MNIVHLLSSRSLFYYHLLLLSENSHNFPWKVAQQKHVKKEYDSSHRHPHLMFCTGPALAQDRSETQCFVLCIAAVFLLLHGASQRPHMYNITCVTLQTRCQTALQETRNRSHVLTISRPVFISVHLCFYGLFNLRKHHSPLILNVE